MKILLEYNLWQKHFMDKKYWFRAFNNEDSHFEIGDKKLILDYIKRGFYVDTKDKNKNTSLLYCIDIEEEELCKMLLDNGADPNISNNIGITPIGLCLIQNYSNILDLLLDNGGNMYDTFSTYHGEEYTYIDFILRRGFSDSLISFIEHKFDLVSYIKEDGMCNKYNNKHVQISIDKHIPEAFEYLIEYDDFKIIKELEEKYEWLLGNKDIGLF
ncbi:ankyrin repeat domain-containing protein [bacterium]|jgi:ankyrin repeat protein|nr:ankyrin repeat domain-containing protein [bacterium]